MNKFTSSTIFFFVCLSICVSSPVYSLDLNKLNELNNYASTAKGLGSSLKPVDAQQEFAMGQEVTAKMFTRYQPVDFESDNAYLNTLGSYLAQFSNRPNPYDGYFFQLVESTQPNAFSAPGGFVLISSGMMEFVQSEDELAAVLAHEIAHISQRHGVNAVKTSQLTRSGMQIGQQFLTEKAGKLGSSAGLLTAGITNSAGDLVTNLVEKGHSRIQEYDADEEAVKIIYRAGYDVAALLRVVRRLGGDDKETRSLTQLLSDVQRSHPSGADRVERISALIAQYETDSGAAVVRSQRLREHSAQIKARKARPDMSNLTDVEEMMRYPPYSNGMYGF